MKPFSVHLFWAVPALGLFAASADAIVVPGTLVSMDPPADFELADGFSGFQHEDGSSIIIAEFPREAHTELAPIFGSPASATAGFASRGVTITDVTTIPLGDDTVPFLTGTQSSHGVEVAKYMTLLDGEKTVLITFNVIDPETLTAEMARSAVSSIEMMPEPTIEEKLAELPFTFVADAPYQTQDTVAGSGVLLNTTGGIDPTGREPIIIIARARNRSNPSQVSELSERLMFELKEFGDATITRSESVSFAGGDGHLIEATKGEMMMVQYVRIPEGGVYVRFVAQGAKDLFESTLPAVRRVAKSVKLAP